MLTKYLMKLLVFIIVPIMNTAVLYLKFWDKDNPLNQSIDENLAYGILLVGNIYAYFISFFSPFKILQSLYKNRWDVLDVASKSLFKEFDEYEGMSFNVMIVKRFPFSRMEPQTKGSNKRKWRIFPKVFTVIWHTKGMRKNMMMTTKQGLCGVAFEGLETKVEEIVQFDAVVGNWEDFNLNKDQIAEAKSVKYIYAVPIAIKRKKAERQYFDIVGVVNVVAWTDQARDFFMNQEKKKTIKEKIVYLADIYKHMHAELLVY